MVTIDENTLDFQGSHGGKMWTTKKHELGGFKCDAICDEAYYFIFNVSVTSNFPPKVATFKKEQVIFLMKNFNIK